MRETLERPMCYSYESHDSYRPDYLSAASARAGTRHKQSCVSASIVEVTGSSGIERIVHARSRAGQRLRTIESG